MKREPRWLSRDVLLAVHARTLAEHGGAAGVREPAALESVLAAPRNAAVYGAGDHFDLAAAYASSLVRLHPFVDGNKRVALVAAGVFLELNGHHFAASEADAVGAVLALVTREMSAEQFAAWLRLACGETPAKRPARASRAKRTAARPRRKRES